MSLRVLFADGNGASKSVRYVSETADAPTKVGPFEVPGTKNHYRAPELPRLDGASLHDVVDAEIAALASKPKLPTLLYFTGHGSLASDLKVSQFDLWDKQRYAVPDLVKALKPFAQDQPITILMVQCHSGDFANVLYKDGDPAMGLAANRVCGFFASISPRVAAGCSPAMDEAYYKDFSSYFLAALTGIDRVGRPVTGADFDRNGKVGMDEAFCWSLVNDDSIDTPICTTDEFLRAMVKMPDENIFKTSYKQVLEWAIPAQRAGLEGLSAKLKLSGDDRLSSAFTTYAKLGANDMSMTPILGYRFVRLAKSVVLAHQMAGVKDPAVRARFKMLQRDEAANPFKN